MKILAFDIGGTKISSAVVSVCGNLLSPIECVPTPKTAEKIEKYFINRMNVEEFDGVAVATAGVVWNEKLLAKPHNLPAGYENINFHKFTDKPVLVENDANAALWAEYKIGVLKGTEHSIMLTLGTGVGCGIICGGKILRGKTGAAGELSFLIAGGDLANIASQNGLNEKDCFALCKLKDEHNPAAVKTFAEWQERLIDCLALLNNILDIEAVALSGSLAEIVDYPVVEKAVNAKGYHNPLCLKKAQTGANAGLIGAALLLKDKING